MQFQLQSPHVSLCAMILGPVWAPTHLHHQRLQTLIIKEYGAANRVLICLTCYCYFLFHSATKQAASRKQLHAHGTYVHTAVHQNEHEGTLTPCPLPCKLITDPTSRSTVAKKPRPTE